MDTGGNNGGAGLGDLTKYDTYNPSCDELDPGRVCYFHVTYTVLPGEENPLDNSVEVHYHPVGLSDDISASDTHSISIPEPRSVSLAAFAALGLLVLRRCR